MRGRVFGGVSIACCLCVPRGNVASRLTILMGRSAFSFVETAAPEVWGDIIEVGGRDIAECPRRTHGSGVKGTRRTRNGRRDGASSIFMRHELTKDGPFALFRAIAARAPEEA